MGETEKEKDEKKEKAEVQLNVTYFYDNEESLNLISAEEALGGYDEDNDFELYARPEKVYEIYFGRHYCRLSRSSLLALALFLTMAAGIIMIAVVLVCTFVSLSDQGKPAPKEDLMGVINWLHYPIGDLSLKRANHTPPHPHTPTILLN